MQKQWLKKKANGSSIIIMLPFIILVIMILFYANNYTRSADIVADNFKTALDASNLSATTANLTTLMKEESLSLLNKKTDSAILDGDEKTWVQKRFVIFEKALKNNVGLNDDFTFSGGTCGWAVNQIVARKEENGVIKEGTLKIDEFIIYEIVGTNVYSYKVSDVEYYVEAPSVSKAKVGTVTKDVNGIVLTSTATTPEGVKILVPTLYTKVSFPVEPPRLMNISWVDYSSLTSDSDIQMYLSGEKIVSKTSTTGLKFNN